MRRKELARTKHEYVHDDKYYIIKGKLTKWGGKSARIQFIHDNTNKAIAEKKLFDISYDRKQLLDLMPGGVFRYRADKNDDTFDFISTNMLKMLGYEKDEFIKKYNNRFSNMVYVDDRERVLNEINDQIKVGEIDECEYRIEKKDGTLCWVNDIGRFVITEKGDKMFYVTIVDITKEHNLAISYLEEEMKLNIALSHTKIQYWEHDLLTDTSYSGSNGKEVNFEQIIPNYSEFMIKSDIIPKEYLHLYLEQQEKLVNGAKFIEYDIPAYLEKGKLSWWHICCTNIFDEKGKPIKTIGTAENIDFEKKYQKFIENNKDTSN